MIIRATQKKMISDPVTRTLVGWNVSRSSRLLRPSERRKRPEPRREPRVEDVFVLRRGRRIRRRRIARGSVLRHGHVTVGAVPHRNPVPPPELPRDAPVPDVVHPAQVDVAPARRVELDLASFDHVDRRASASGCIRHEPLARDERLDHRAAPVVLADRVPVRLDLLDEPLLLERRARRFRHSDRSSPRTPRPPRRSSSPRGRSRPPGGGCAAAPSRNRSGRAPASP